MTIHQLYYSNYSSSILKLVSFDEAYFIIVLDASLHELQKISIKINDPLSHIDIILKTVEQDYDERIILTYVNESGIEYRHYSFKGECLYQKHFPREEDILMIFHNPKNFITLGYDDITYEPVKMVWIEDETDITVDLSDGDLYLTKNLYHYEYVECITSTNRPGQFALIATHANYGVQGVKIFDIDRDNLRLVYDLDDLEFNGAFHNLTFNSDGSEFVVLLYQRDEYLKDYFSICVYSVQDELQPLKVIRTDYAYWEYNSLHTYYLTNSLLCIVRSCDIIIYDLELEREREQLNRDLRSAYFLSFGVVIYQYNGITTIRRFS